MNERAATIEGGLSHVTSANVGDFWSTSPLSRPCSHNLEVQLSAFSQLNAVVICKIPEALFLRARKDDSWAGVGRVVRSLARSPYLRSSTADTHVRPFVSPSVERARI